MFTVDDRSTGKVPFRMDGRAYSFGRATKTPGVATLSYYSFDLSHTPLHEFGHAASELTNGRIIDLYHDQTDSSVLQINKKSEPGDASQVQASSKIRSIYFLIKVYFLLESIIRPTQSSRRGSNPEQRPSVYPLAKDSYV